jgi:hypothetical protein
MQRYNNESMLPPKLGDAWIPKILTSIEKHRAILDLEFSVFVISKELFDFLNLKNIENFSIYLLFAGDSTKKESGRVNDVMVELHMTYVHVDFIVMYMGSNTSSPIILGNIF